MFSSSQSKSHGYRYCRIPLSIFPKFKFRVAFIVTVVVLLVCDVSSTNDIFSNSFLVRFRRNVEQQEAHKIANKHGFVNMGPVSLLVLSYLVNTLVNISGMQTAVRSVDIYSTFLHCLPSKN